MTGRTLSKSFPYILHSGMFSTDESISMEELKEYYSDLFQDDFFVNVKIVGTRIMDINDERYTVYIIQVELPFTEYRIEKRYTQFLEMYKKIERNYKDLGIDQNNFPAKSSFSTFTESTIQHRKTLLDKILKFLSEHYKKEQIIEFVEFLEIKQRIEWLTRVPTTRSMGSLRPDGEWSSGSDMDQVNYYLNIFNYNTRNLCQSFKEFEVFLFEKRPKFSRKAIHKLFHGDEILDGLIHLCGKSDHENDSHLTCGAGLQLFVRLLDHEYNLNAEIYSEIFGRIGLRDIMCFQFDKHIRAKGFKSCKVSAMKLLNNFISRNPNIAIDQILREDEVIQEFETWKSSQKTTSIKAENYFKLKV